MTNSQKLTPQATTNAFMRQFWQHGYGQTTVDELLTVGQLISSWCLGEALRGSLHPHRHHIVVLTELIYYLDVLLDQEGDGRHQAERVQNAEVSCVQYLIGWIAKTFDYINRVT